MAKKRYRKRRRKLRTEPVILIVLIVFALASFLLIRAIKTRQEEEAEMKLVHSPLFEHSYDWDKLKKSGDFMSYEDDQYTSLQGIDVSYHQGKIDWTKVKEDGIDVAFIRCVYRGDYDGELHDDT